METLKIHEQIAFLRKQKGFTQEDLAKALGVTNQAVSKWEAAQCCPDIQLLPRMAGIFDVSVDALLGYKPTEGLGDICLKIKDYFMALPEKGAFESAYRMAALLHEAAATDGYKNRAYWQEKDYAREDVSSWGLSICSQAEGSTGRKHNSIFFSLGKGYVSPKGAQLGEIKTTLEALSDLNVLKVLCLLCERTLADPKGYVTVQEIADAVHLKVEEAETALEKLPLSMKEEESVCSYRLDEAFLHIPSLLSFFCRF